MPSLPSPAARQHWTPPRISYRRDAEGRSYGRGASRRSDTYYQRRKSRSHSPRALPCPALRLAACLALARRTWPGFAMSTSSLDFFLPVLSRLYVVLSSTRSLTHSLPPSRPTLACCCVPPLPHVKPPCSPFSLSLSGSWTRPGDPGGCSCVEGSLHKRRPLISVSSNQWSRVAGSARSKQLGSPERDLRCCVCVAALKRA